MADNRPVVANLDFDTIKQDIIDHFKGREEFKDYDFTGSGLNLLLDVLAYNTHYNSLAANFLTNEMFLDSAVLRGDVVSIAKMLNYQPRSITAASANITLRIPRIGNETFRRIPAGSQFSAANGNSSLTFYTLRDYTVQYEVNDSEAVTTVEAKEGQIVSQRFVQNASNQDFSSFDLLNNNIDTSTVLVSVNGSNYTRVTPEEEGITAVTRESTVFFIEENRDAGHKLVFGNGVVGKKLEVGDEVIVSYLVTSGEEGNGINSFTHSISGGSDITITNVARSGGGSSPESIREIKDNAPAWYQSQYRAVTEDDYEAIIRKKFSDIQSIRVYGGERVNSPGKVFIAIKPKSGDALPASVKTTLENDIVGSSNIVTVTPEIVDPNIINLVLKTVVIYDNSRLTSTPEALRAKILTMLNVFNSSYIGDFLENYRESRLSAEIQNLDNAVEGSNTRVSLRYDVTSTNQVLSRYAWSFENKLYHPQAGFRSNEGGILSTNLFQRVGNQFLSGFDEDGNGNIRLYDYIDEQKVYIISTAGTIDYNTGAITLHDRDRIFNPVDGSIQFSVVPDSFDVVADNNTILRIATDDSSIQMLEKNQRDLIRNLNLSRTI